MNNRYFFDKRDWKRRWGKFGIIFLISFLPIVLFNVLVSDYIGQDWLVVFIDCVFLLVFIAVGNHIADKILDKKDRKQERLRKEREELEEMKLKIMEDSYKRKRAEKQKAKVEKGVDVIIVEDDTANEGQGHSDSTNTKISTSQNSQKDINKVKTPKTKNAKVGVKSSVKKSTSTNVSTNKGEKKR